MKINKKLFLVKAHYFFFMAAMGPILPQLSVYGKELGISSVVMGTITGSLPFAFLLAKPAFGVIVDVYRGLRKFIFMTLIGIMVAAFALLYFIPARPLVQFAYDGDRLPVERCNDTIKRLDYIQCDNQTIRVICSSQCLPPTEFLAEVTTNESFVISADIFCRIENETTPEDCAVPVVCDEDIEGDNGCLYKTVTFWGFVILLSVGTIGYNVTNSISDAICFDVIGDKYDYGKQRVWGTVGFGVAALIAGYIEDLVSGLTISYTPAFIIMLICAAFDLSFCFKLKLPVIEAPKHIFEDLRHLMNNRHVVIFITFAVFAGIVDSMIIYFLFWFLEDLAENANTSNVKVLEGLIVAAETLGGEVVFFSVSGKILERFGHVRCFSMCFAFYALRLGLISVVPSPWWILPVEFLLQGPTYALTYTTIVAYANELAPPGASATMQGIAAGMDDGVGYAVGSVVGGILYKYLGGKSAFQVYSAFALFCSITHTILHETLLKRKGSEDSSTTYKTPEEAITKTVSHTTEK